MIKNSNFLGVLAILPVKGVIIRCSKALTKNVFEFYENKLRCGRATTHKFVNNMRA